MNRGTMHEEAVRIERAVFERARDLARAAHEPHNQAREIFIDEVIDALGRRIVGRMGAQSVVDPGAELRSDPDVAAAIEDLWPGLRPRTFLASLLARPAELEQASPQLSAAERALLKRTSPAWTPADVPLLDELAELLGPLRTVQHILGEREAIADLEDELDYAQETLEELGIETVNAEQLLVQHEGELILDSVADRARVDRSWTFGHVIVDEAQELSPMVWRVLMRRCPSRSMTVVGDIAQTGSVAGTRSWAAVLDPYAQDRWRLEPLSLNYRTPSQIMAVAARVLEVIDPTLVAPAAVREGGSDPWSLACADADELLDVLPGLVKEELAALGEGRLAVIAPHSAMPALIGGLAGVTFAEDPEALEAAAVVLTVEQSKGLEFDAVLLVEPQDVLLESAGGVRDLYVAVTRATQRLGIVHTGTLPDMLSGTVPRD